MTGVQFIYIFPFITKSFIILKNEKRKILLLISFYGYLDENEIIGCKAKITKIAAKEKFI